MSTTSYSIIITDPGQGGLVIFTGHFTVNNTTNYIQSFYEDGNPTNLLFCTNLPNNFFYTNSTFTNTGLSVGVKYNFSLAPNDSFLIQYCVVPFPGVCLQIVAFQNIGSFPDSQQAQWCAGAFPSPIQNLGRFNFTFAVIPNSDICFPAGTPISTNQGLVPIEALDTNLHTIHGKPIVGITKTTTFDKYLICFEKSSLGRNIPNQRTIMSKDHRIEFESRMVPAYRFLDFSREVKKVNYSGEVLYNVLLEDYEKMTVNNLICETLHPENAVANLLRKGWAKNYSM